MKKKTFILFWQEHKIVFFLLVIERKVFNAASHKKLPSTPSGREMQRKEDFAAFFFTACTNCCYHFTQPSQFYFNPSNFIVHETVRKSIMEENVNYLDTLSHLFFVFSIFFLFQNINAMAKVL